MDQDKNKKIWSPKEVPDFIDPGDETQRNFRYQISYGAILLIASVRGDNSYHSIWCEHHDDYLCQRQDELFDAYQIKTKKPERGYWKLNDAELKRSIRKFCDLKANYAEHIDKFFFVSNTEALNVSLDSKNQGDLARSPVQFLRAIRSTKSDKDIPRPFYRAFKELLRFCEHPPNILYSVLKKLFLIKGPGRDSFDAEIVQKHLPSLATCSNLPIPILNKIYNQTIQKIYMASSLSIEDPNQHVTPLDTISLENPLIKAKRVTPKILDEIVSENLLLHSESQSETSQESLIKTSPNKRNIVFVYSHPSDGDFAKWLTVQLINNGYAVWCDEIDFDIGDEAIRKREILLTEETIKFIFVLSKISNQDVESLKNLKFAYDLSHKRSNDWIVITQVTELSLPKNILLNSALMIPFYESWAMGLNHLLEKLDSANIPIDLDANPLKSNSIWRRQFNPDRGVTNDPDEYLSNWFRIELPEKIHFHELQRIGIGLITTPEDLHFPKYQHNQYIITFAPIEDVKVSVGDEYSVRDSTIIPTQDFLQGEYNHKYVSPKQTWNIVLNLLNQAWEMFFDASEMGKYELSNSRICYYFHKGFGNSRVTFQGLGGQKSWRSLIGKKGVNNWHFAIQGRANLHPFPHYLVKTHVLFSNDGYNIWNNHRKLHKARRSWCKNWWNDLWRDRLLASISLIADANPILKISVGSEIFVKVSSFPEIFISPISYAVSNDDIMYDDSEVIDEDDSLDEFEDSDE